MSLYKTHCGQVSHADAVPEVKSVPSRRQAEMAFVKIISHLSFEQVDDVDREINVLRDFLWSR